MDVRPRVVPVRYVHVWSVPFVAVQTAGSSVLRSLGRRTGACYLYVRVSCSRRCSWQAAITIASERASTQFRPVSKPTVGLLSLLCARRCNWVTELIYFFADYPGCHCLSLVIIVDQGSTYSSTGTCTDSDTYVSVRFTILP